MATDGWYPPAIDNHAPNDGGSHLGPVTIGVLHTTESTRFIPNQDNYFGHSSYPHFTCVVTGGVFFVYQHISIRRAARALKNLSGGVQTNREGVIQIEVVGRATEPFTNNPVMVRGLTQLMRWIESQTEIEAQSRVHFNPYPQSYGRGIGNQRLTYDQWQRYVGWLGHQHVPENDHGDPGAISISMLMQVPNNPPPDTTPKEAPLMFIATANTEQGRKSFLIMGNTRKWIRRQQDLANYLKNGVPEYKNLSEAEVLSFPEVGL